MSITVFQTVISILIAYCLIQLFSSGQQVAPAPEVLGETKNEETHENQDDSASPEVSDVVDEPRAEDQPQVTQDEDSTNHYRVRNQLWSAEEWAWKDYDPSERPVPLEAPPRCDLHNYFYINHRYNSVREKPTTVLSDFTPILIAFLRAHIGDEFFSDEPVYELKKFFPDLKMLHEEFDEIRLAVENADMAAAEKRDVARAVGAMDAEYGHLGDDAITQYLSDVVEHVRVLLEYVDEQFKPTADRIALQTSYGQIEWDLLIYYFERNVTCSTFDPEGQIAFVVTSRAYHYSMHPYFQVEGRMYFWDGMAYATVGVSRTIEQYKGSKDLKSLSCRLLGDDVKEKLQARGRLYASFSGMHYRSYLKDRVVVDRKAYNNTSGYVADPDFVAPTLAEDKLHLLPPHVYGFNLSKKAWTDFNVEQLKPVVFDENAWDHLVLDPDTKALIRGLVEVTKNANSTKTIISDVISGKGGGLIAVLHGPPGTGKTLTAEAVAEYLQRPLYMVGSSELPTDPSSLEYSLRGILQLATAWDAVLLIDEADVYLEQRSLHELERNALVSVALRVLEYHRGVLFLTTNRIKSFDDAFLSRFSIGIKYPELDQAARRTVWRKFFELAGIAIDGDSKASSESEIVAISIPGSPTDKAFVTLEDIDELSVKPFNGRTIKNLVRTSQALALASNEPLSVEHVRIVVRASEKFLDEFAEAKA
ncbi:P-loop containing nucleoside triphosphate hydrolase protein [Heliocybe sulcata]|uniref:P-loop containing nucleoside triphosphate hydrolase protein n=1 Tax=Heliocybe sulcata TaxID=5364 RepID=A0A5C3MV45_9AGAM|nr:P-loop containing nucleoside triphosphate hydrolase protein [Heliocybe sulcata]